MICPHCQGEIADGAKFCKHCGQSVIIEPKKDGICPKCGIENTPTAKFCKECGESLVKEVAETQKVESIHEPVAPEPKQQGTVKFESSERNPTILSAPPQGKKVMPVAIGVAALILAGAIGGFIYYQGTKDSVSNKTEEAITPSSPTEIESAKYNNRDSNDEPGINVLSQEAGTEPTLPQPDSAIFDQAVSAMSDEEYLALKSMSPDFAKADHNLNQAFGKLRKEISSGEKEKLKKDQNKWIKIRNQNAYNAGAKGSEAYLQSLIFQSNQREKELKNSINQESDAYLDTQMQDLKNFDK